MKSLATHAANSGVTTSEQTEADQAELDSAIQTMDRIAQTTEFSGEKLLNGNKELTFDVTTAVMGTQQNQLVNVRESTFNQIFKRDGYSVSIGYTGAAGTIDKTTGVGTKVDFSKQATKAYMEVDTGTGTTAQPKAQVTNGKFTQEQVFTLTGSLGSRQFTFGKNSSVADMVKDIHSTSGSTGVDAALIFNSDQKITVLDAEGSADPSASGRRYTGAEQAIFGTKLMASGMGIEEGVSRVALTGSSIQWGKNTDGQGNIYVKYVSDTEVELYKDSSMSRESLVGTASSAKTLGVYDFTEYVTIQAANNSGLAGTIDFLEEGPQFAGRPQGQLR